MIPRHDGLVPVMRPQGHPPAGGPATPQSQQQSPPPSLKRYTLFLPEQLEGVENGCTSGPSRGMDGGHAKRLITTGDTDSDLRLYSFVASADCPLPPSRIFATGVDDLNRAAELFVSIDNGYSLDDDGTSGGGATRGRAAGGEAQEGRRPRRVPMKKGEPCRLLYTTVADSESEADEDGGAKRPAVNWRLCSTALPEYEHLTCVMLTAVAGEQGGTDGESNSSSCSSTPHSALTARALSRPVMELRAERVGGAEGEDARGGPGGHRCGISASWLSVPTVKFNSKDWKSMDDMDRAEAAAASRDGGDDEAVERRWTGDNVDDDGTDEGSRPAAKKARTKAPTKGETGTSATAIQSALAQNRQLLQARREAEEAAARARHGGISFTPASASSSYGYRAGTQSVPSPSFPGSEEHSSGEAEEERRAVPPPPPQQEAQSAPPPSLNRQAKEQPQPEGAALDSCSRAVLHELRVAERRQYASLKELEKLILRRLPAYEAAAHKMKDPARKNEAVAWFRQMQKELKLWLIRAGCTVDPTGIVTFPRSN